MERELSELAVPVGWALGLYVVATYVLGFAVKSRVHDAEDFLVAGRRLPLSLAWATLLATWFGAGTMLTAADEVRSEGLSAIALEPLGSGLCLVVAGLFFARRLWDMKLLTMSDFFARRFGRRAARAGRRPRARAPREHLARPPGRHALSAPVQPRPPVGGTGLAERRLDARRLDAPSDHLAIIVELRP